ncbi:MAG: A/G-specific adenine glycosylase [Dehalococcoidia bacterium]|nr:A/G-specific adenine glycosylase [Dehalococcoidia bacterium]
MRGSELPGEREQIAHAEAPPALTPARVRRIRTAFLGWYDANGNDFPWRDARDPYAALVAAVCSQQTQMSRVLPLWERWMAAFPTLEAAAEADRAEVLRVWAGAGYPRRALALRDTARRCLEEHRGTLPRDPEALLALPGVGPFTAAVVRCFGWADPAPAIDTNVVRVLGRLVHGDLQPAKETPSSEVVATAEALLPPADVVRWNPALMDYGAKVCLPRPRCEACVVADECAARPRFARGETADPVRAQARFEDSNRQWRGRILRALREHEGAMRVSTLVRGLARSPGEEPKLRALLDGLCSEGMAWRHGAWCGLGDRPAPPPRGASRARRPASGV